MMESLPAPAGPPFSLALGISIGLLASFIQSIGLTLQRKSHLYNQSLPLALRRPDYARPAWLVGFSVYFGFNILGSIFQIGALPLILLGPLGAISLLWNAILARCLLGDRFSLHLVFGTVFIGLGALLIGLFGLLPDQSHRHSLQQLLRLYSRPAFLAEIALLILVFSAVCALAHLHESRLSQSRDSISLLTISPPLPTPLTTHQSPSSPSPSHPDHPVRQIQHTPLPLTAPPQQHSVDIVHPHIHQNLSPGPSRSSKPSDSSHHSSYPVQLSISQDSVPIGGCPHELVYSTQKEIDQTKLLIGIAYGSTSGTLSGICLLFAKTGVELLIRTLSGVENEFGKIQTWLILLVLLISALLQLWYLNKALRLVNPTLICPLAFCFYNLSSIISSLVYYDQIKLLSAFQVIAISLGTTILLGGVWVVSIGTNTPPSTRIGGETREDQEDDTQGSRSSGCEEEVTPLLGYSSRIEDLEEEERAEEEEHARPSAEQTHESFHASHRLSDSDCHDGRRTRARNRQRRSLQLDSRPSTAGNSHPFDQLIRQFVVDGHVTPVRGFSFGLGAASPGFAIRPKRRNNRLSEPSRRTPSASFGYNSYPVSPQQRYQQQEGEEEEEEGK